MMDQIAAPGEKAEVIVSAWGRIPRWAALRIPIVNSSRR